MDAMSFDDLDLIIDAPAGAAPVAAGLAAAFGAA
jgi:hypothetical protein